MAANIHSLIDSQLENLTTLSSLLEQELHLISGRDADALMQLLAEKSNNLEAIAKMDSAIAEVYQSLTETERSEESLQNKISETQSLLEDCKYRTSVNQKAV